MTIVLCGAVALSYAQQAATNAGGEGWKGHRHGYMGRMARELNLTDAQKAQIKTMAQAQRATNRPLMQQMAQNRLALLNATSGGAFDQAKVEALANQQAQLMAQMQVQKAQLRSQIYNQVLTADQKTKADQLQQQKIARINEHMQKWSQAGSEAPQAQ
jgi:protein CpxP